MSESTILNIKLKELPGQHCWNHYQTVKIYTERNDKTYHLEQEYKEATKNGFRYVKATETEMITYIRKAEKENQL